MNYFLKNRIKKLQTIIPCCLACEEIHKLSDENFEKVLNNKLHLKNIHSCTLFKELENVTIDNIESFIEKHEKEIIKKELKKGEVEIKVNISNENLLPEEELERRIKAIQRGDVEIFINPKEEV